MLRHFVRSISGYILESAKSRGWSRRTAGAGDQGAIPSDANAAANRTLDVGVRVRRQKGRAGSIHPLCTPGKGLDLF